MQVGVIKVDGRQIGSINFTVGPSGPVVPYMGMEGVDASGAEAPIGGQGAGPHGAQDHGDAHHDQKRRHNSLRNGFHQAPASHLGSVKVGKGDDPRGNEAYIREKAKEYGHDPDTAVAVAKSEGLRDFSGDRGTSFGAFQLHKHGGLGDEFQKQTGLDPADPKNERATIDWAMKNLSRTGWTPYHGGHNRYGLGKFEGVGGRSSHITPDVAKVGAATSAPANTTQRELPRARGVDPRIGEIVGAAAKHLPEGYTVAMTSGYRGPKSSHNPNHHGNAADYQITDPNGSVIPNRGNDPTGMYTQLARHSYGEMLARHPDLKGKFAWGGAFGTALGGGGQRDLMHFDVNGERGRYVEHHLSRMGPMPGVKYGPATVAAKPADKMAETP